MNALRFHRISTRIKHVTRADSDRRFGLFREGDRFARSEAYTLLQSDPRRLPSSNFSTGRRRIDYPAGDSPAIADIGIPNYFGNVSYTIPHLI